MKIEKFIDQISHVCDVKKKEHGVQIHHRSFHTDTFLTDEEIEQNELKPLLHKIHQGKNVEHITRVTGYFSRSARGEAPGWNPGKMAELKDRYRSSV